MHWGGREGIGKVHVVFVSSNPQKASRMTFTVAATPQDRKESQKRERRIFASITTNTDNTYVVRFGVNFVQTKS